LTFIIAQSYGAWHEKIRKFPRVQGRVFEVVFENGVDGYETINTVHI